MAAAQRGVISVPFSGKITSKTSHTPSLTWISAARSGDDVAIFAYGHPRNYGQRPSHLNSGERIPQANPLVGARQEQFSRTDELHEARSSGMRQRRSRRSSIGRIPKAYDSVFMPRCELFSIRTEGHAVNLIVVAKLRQVQERSFMHSHLLTQEEWDRRPIQAQLLQNIARLADSFL